MDDRQVARVKPAAAEGFARRLLVLQVALHRDVAAEHHFADGLAVPGHRLQRLRVQHGHTFLQRVAHALPAIEHRALADIERGPVRLPGADGRRPVDLGQTVDVRQVEAEPVHALDHRRRRSRGGHHRADPVVDAALQFVRCVDQHRVHDRRAAVVRHAMLHGSRRTQPPPRRAAGRHGCPPSPRRSTESTSRCSGTSATSTGRRGGAASPRPAHWTRHSYRRRGASRRRPWDCRSFPTCSSGRSRPTRPRAAATQSPARQLRGKLRRSVRRSPSPGPS